VNGTVTFLLTDVAHSTLLWDRDAEAMTSCLVRHDAIIAEGVARNNGRLIKARGEGDSHFIVFDHALDAALAALEIQRDLQDESWTTIEPLKVRMAIHLGEIEDRDGDYYGQEVNRAARLRGIAHGGQILVSSVVRELVYHRLPTHCWLVDLGEHRLRDLLRAEHVYQLAAEGLALDYPRLDSLDVAKTNLPIQLTSFIGREDDIDLVRTLLVEHRLITLLGPGGCGKTRLAIQAAAESMDEYPDGVWFVDLASVEEDDAVERTVASALSIPLNPGSNLQTNISSYLAGKKLLIVLDNCEHLGEGPANFVGATLKSVQDVRFLTTSRRPLGLRSEHSYLVRPLTKPAAGASTRKKVLSSESVQLMIDRAWAKAPAFQITDGNAKAVASLCTALEGMPLAIELAASRLRVLSPEQLFERLSKSLDLLKSASTDADARHRTLRATVEWSFNLLKSEEKDLLCRMSLLPAGCSLEIAEIAAADLFEDKLDVLDILESLVNNSLIQVEGGELPRYRMLETIRQYCAEQLQEGVKNGVFERLLPWAIEFARSTKPMLNGQEQKRVRARIEGEYENLRACLAWASEHPHFQNALLSLASELDRYWFQSGMLSEGSEWLQKALAGPGGDQAQRAVTLRSAGVFAWQSREYADAGELLGQSVEAFRRLGDTKQLTGAISNLAMALGDAGQADRAASCFLEALELARTSNDAALAGLVLQNLGYLERDRGNPDRAMDYFLEALSLVSNTEEGQTALASLLSSIAGIHQLRGEPVEATSAFEKSVAVSKGLNNSQQYTLAVLLSNIAGIHRIRGETKEAAIALKHSIGISRDLNNLQLLGDHVFNLAQVAYADDHPEMAARLLGCCRFAWKVASYTPSKQALSEAEGLGANLREALAPTVLAEALASGNGMTLAEMADYALAGSDLLADRLP